MDTNKLKGYEEERDDGKDDRIYGIYTFFAEMEKLAWNICIDAFQSDARMKKENGKFVNHLLKEVGIKPQGLKF